MSCIVFCRTVV